MKKVTSKDVARMAGVSQATVSMVLNNKVGPSFSEETKNKVLDAAARLGYSLPAQGNIKSLRNLITVMVPTLTNPFYTHLASNIERCALAAGYKIMICNTLRNKEYEAYYLDYLSSTKVAGIIFTFVPSYPQLVEQLSVSLPIILIGEKTEELSIPSIELNNIKAGIIMGEHLLSLGHRHFAFFTTPQNSMSLARKQREEGLRQALLKAGLDGKIEIYADSAAEEHDLGSLPFEYETGYALAKRFLSGGGKATALIAVNDMMALGLLRCLADNGKKVPGEFSVSGFDNIFSGRISSPEITTIDHHLDLRAQSAVDMILSKLAKDKKSEGSFEITPEVNRIEYMPQLVIRGSTGKNVGNKSFLRR